MPQDHTASDETLMERCRDGDSPPRTDLPPGKWLERIEVLRRQGKLEEAKTSLAKLRKRYPDYELPASLKDWAKP